MKWFFHQFLLYQLVELLGLSLYVCVISVVKVQGSVYSYAHAQEKIDPCLQDKHTMASPSDFCGGKSNYVRSMKVLLVTRPPTVMWKWWAVCELCRFLKKKKNGQIVSSHTECLWKCLANLSVLVARLVLIEHGEVYTL